MDSVEEFEHSSPPTPEELARYDLNDYGNAMRLIRLAGGEIDYAGRVQTANIRLLYQLGGGWVAYNGKYWDRETGEQLAWRMAQEVGVKMQDMVDELIIQTGAAAAVVQKFVDSCGSRSACSNMLAMAAPHLTVKIESFDRNPMVLNCANGTVVLEPVSNTKLGARLKPHDPADRITRFIEIDFDPDAKAPLFGSTLTASLPKAPVRDFFQRSLGYTATGHTREQAFFMCQGLGRDGKSTLISAVRKTLGGYASPADAKTFMDIGQVSSASASPDLAELAGDIRMVALSEAKRDALLNEALLKQWTGEEPVPARALNAKPFKFVAIGKLWWQFNGWPKAQGNDDGLWRRLFPIPFEHQVDPKDVDRMLGVKLEAEQPGILNWIIEGIGQWWERGQLDPPPEVLEARERYRRTSSPFMDWLETRCVYGKVKAGDAATSSKELYNDFKEWSTDQGHEKVMSATSFGRAMGERQIHPIKRNGNIYRTPIRLKTMAERAGDEGVDVATFAAQASATKSMEADFGSAAAFGGEDDKW